MYWCRKKLTRARIKKTFMGVIIRTTRTQNVAENGSRKRNVFYLRHRKNTG